MKKKILAILLVLGSSQSFAEQDLSQKLESLNIPSDKVTPLLSEEDLYAVNERYSSLNKRFELTLFGAHDFAADPHLDTKQSGLTARFHYNSRWSAGLRYTEYFNQLTPSGKALFEEKQLLPDSDFALKSSEGFINFNTVYGKVRLTKDTIVYFDQYIALGYGNISLSRGEVQMYTAHLGLSFWVGKNMSARFGVKNEFYAQKKVNGDDNVHNAMGYLEIGYLFGQGSRL
ncbi:MAG: outer membrane beta-barrel domain-containing protein [Bdellovibrionota bacterium]|nr:outer membrane beta-barrel domain-containing protein [Bdellovibrionota bacterium]